MALKPNHLAGHKSLLKRDMSVFRDMARYVRRPHFIARPMPFGLHTLSALLKLLVFAVLMLPVLGLVMGVLVAVSGVSLPDPSDDFQDMMKQSNFIFLAAIVAPLVEEGLFRSWLGKRWGVLLIAPLLLGGIVLWMTFKPSADAPSEFSLLMIILMLGSFAVYIMRYLKLRREDAVLEAALAKVFPFAFWGTSLAFGAMHLANYEDGSMGLLLPVLVMPQFMIGVMLGYIRMRFGLLAAMVFHGAYNGLVVTVITTLAGAA